jgi:hypothetical protein
MSTEDHQIKAKKKYITQPTEHCGSCVRLIRLQKISSTNRQINLRQIKKVQCVWERRKLVVYPTCPTLTLIPHKK